MYAHLNDPAPAASPLAPGIPPALDAVIGTAMAKAPGERYASAGDLARAAWAALQGELAPAPVGSVATGAAAVQTSRRVPDTPAPAAAAVARPRPPVRRLPLRTAHRPRSILGPPAPPARPAGRAAAASCCSSR